MFGKKPEKRFADVESLEKALAACQCADKWNDERATAWWNAVEVSQSATRVEQ